MAWAELLKSRRVELIIEEIFPGRGKTQFGMRDHGAGVIRTAEVDDDEFVIGDGPEGVRGYVGRFDSQISQSVHNSHDGFWGGLRVRVHVRP